MIDLGPIADGSWTAKLIEWCLGASLGDGGERPRLEIELEGDGWWSVECSSFYDGHADARARTLEEAAQEAHARLTSHPERQREAELVSVAWALAHVTNLSHQEARKVLDGLLASLAVEKEPGSRFEDPGRVRPSRPPMV